MKETLLAFFVMFSALSCRFNSGSSPASEAKAAQACFPLRDYSCIVDVIDYPPPRDRSKERPELIAMAKILESELGPLQLREASYSRNEKWDFVGIGSGDENFWREYPEVADWATLASSKHGDVAVHVRFARVRGVWVTRGVNFGLVVPENAAVVQSIAARMADASRTSERVGSGFER